MKIWLVLILLFTSFVTQAVTVAVIDTGFDLDHETLKPRLKLGETDEEGAIALPGFVGWDFADNTHLKTSAIQPEVLQEVLLYRALKAKSHQQGLSPDERAWLDRKAQDATFKEQLRIFKRHAHGTLVTGILLSQGEGIDVFPVRGLGIDVPTLLVETPTEATSPVVKHSQAEFERQVKLSEDRVIRKMRKMLAWVNIHKIRVVNGSYGVTEKHIQRRFSEWHKEITGLELDPQRLKEIVDRYFTSLYKRANLILARYPETIFIFSAGNSHQNNDEHHHFPSRVRRNHVVSVAALNGDYLASFSNWGKEHVDVAAPGVGVMSLVPSVYAKQTGLTQTPASGTSMAAPSVANLAARCIQINSKLKAREIKTILLETGEALTDLATKTTSGRAVHPARALKAAQLSLEMSVPEAIKLAMSDLVPLKEEKPDDIQNKLMQTLPKVEPAESDEPTDVTPSSPSSSSPDPVIETPGKSAPPAPVVPSDRPSTDATPTVPSL